MADDGKGMLLQFQSELHAWSKVLDRSLADVVRIITLEVYREIILRNPVDTGYSRSQWNVAINAPDTSVGEKPKGKGKIPPKPAPILTGIDGKQKVYVTNSLDYIRFLEEGSSQQAPSGFIRIAIAKVEAKVDAMVQQARSEGFRA